MLYTCGAAAESKKNNQPGGGSMLPSLPSVTCALDEAGVCNRCSMHGAARRIYLHPVMMGNPEVCIGHAEMVSESSGMICAVGWPTDTVLVSNLKSGQP
jgi:hypothetical protein